MKKTQVTVYIIVGIVTLIIISLFIIKFYQNKYDHITVGSEDPRVQSLVSYVKGCMQETAVESFKELGKHGQIYPKYYIASKNTKIAYYYFEGKSRQTNIEEVASEIEEYIENDIDACIDAFSDRSIVLTKNDAKIDVEVSFENGFSKIILNYPIRVDTGEEVLLVDEFETAMEVDYLAIYDLSKEIVRQVNINQGKVDHDFIDKDKFDVKIVRLNKNTIVYELFEKRYGLDNEDYFFTFAIKEDNFEIVSTSVMNSNKVNLEGMGLDESEVIFVDVTPKSCSKLGFSYYSYDSSYKNLVNDFTNTGSWVIGVATSDNDDFKGALSDMTDFVNEAVDAGNIPIVKILGEKGQEEVVDESIVISFINELSTRTQGNLKYVQVWDKPNVIFSKNERFEDPKEYATYYNNVVNNINLPGIMFLPGTLSSGNSQDMGENRRLDSKEYLLVLIEDEEFISNVKYWPSSLYNPVESDECLISTNWFYEGEVVCMNTKYNHLWEIEIIKEKTGKEFEVIVTESGTPLKPENKYVLLEMLEQVKADPTIISNNFFGIAPASYGRSQFIDRDSGLLNKIAQELSLRSCSE